MISELLTWGQILSWLAVVAYMAPAAWSIVIGHPRHGDSARLICLLYAVLFIGFTIRRLVNGAPVDDSLIVLQTASIVVAWLTIATAHAYGRGARV